MFLVAKKAGADAVKLQKRDNKKLYTKSLTKNMTTEIAMQKLTVYTEKL